MKPKFHIHYVLSIILLLHTYSAFSKVQQWTLMGLDSGELIKCQFENMTNCESLIQMDSPVYSVSVIGEFMYLGLQSGELHRCPFHKPHNCTLFHTFLSELNDLAISGDFIYAATFEGIVKCGLHKSDECTIYYLSQTPIYTVAIVGDRLYAGSDEAILTCALEGFNDCEISNTTSAVTSLGVSGKFLYVGLKEGALQSCELDNITMCVTLLESLTEVKALDVFNEILITSLDSGEILKYILDGSNETEFISRGDNLARSLFTVYDTKGLFYHYRGEGQGCVWQWFGSECPPFVMYYDLERRSQFELKVKNGKLYSSVGKLFDTTMARFGHSGRSAIFVMDPAGRIYASVTHPILLLHHSSLMAGQPVAAAGELMVENGLIQGVSTCSGHYRPPAQLTKQIMTSLIRQGYNSTYEFDPCGFGLYIDLDFKKTDKYYKAMYEEYAQKMRRLGLKQ